MKELVNVLIPLNRVIVIEKGELIGAKIVPNVLIPLNRVIVIEWVLVIEKEIYLYRLNPLKSGHCY